MTFIDFSLLCRKTALTTEAIHQDLKSLAQRRVIRYLPPRQIPIITYLRQRTDAEHIKIDHEIYEDARQRLKTHIDSMLQYINENDTCRERMLMEYFGEETKEDCGHCDVCLQDRN
jgi:ATP-dependent DNA helicase RecQ